MIEEQDNFKISHRFKHNLGILGGVDMNPIPDAPQMFRGGNTTKSYLRWQKEHMNKPHFNSRLPTTNEVMTSKGTIRDKDAFIDKRTQNTLKKDFVISKGVVRQRPSDVINFVYTYEGVDNFQTELRQYLQNRTGKIVISIDTLLNFEYDLTGDWWGNDNIELFYKLFMDSNTSYFRADIDGLGVASKDYNVFIRFFDNLKFVPAQNKQIFADNFNNDCWAVPIERWLDNLEPSKTKDKKIKFLNNLKKKYPDGFPEDLIQTKICNGTLNLGIEIYTPTGKLIFTGRPKDKTKNGKVIRYCNTTHNHIEVFELFNKDRDIINIETAKEMKELFNQHKDKPTLFTKSRRIQGGDTILSFCVGNTKYILKDPIFDANQEWQKRNNIKLIEQENNLYNESAFINQATYVNGEFKFNDLEHEDLEEHDVRKAYASFKKCDYYNDYKFPSNSITDFRFCKNIPIWDVINKTGWSQVDEIKSYPNLHHDLLSFIDLKEKQVYPNVELRCLYDLGYRFTLVATCWSVKNKDIDFDNEMDKCEHPDLVKIPIYSLISGMTLQYSKQNRINYRYTTKPTQEWYDNLAHYDEDIKHIHNLQEKNVVIFTKEKEFVKHANHIGSYITAYVRCIIFKQMAKLYQLGLEDEIYAIRSDAIKMKKGYSEHFDKTIFKEPENVKSLVGDNWNYRNTFNKINTNTSTHPEDFEDWDAGEWKDYAQVVVCLGAGGTGKTTTLCRDTGLTCKTLSLPTNELKIEKATEFKDIDCYTHHSSLNLNVFDSEEKKWKPAMNRLKQAEKNYGNLMIDEITMMKHNVCKGYEGDICTAIEFIKNFEGRVFIMGDWNMTTGMVYQLKPVNTEFNYQLLNLLSPQVLHFEKNYRIKEDKFLEKCNKIRHVMNKYYKKESLNNLNKFVVELFKNRCISREEVYDLYEQDDLIITSTNERKTLFNTHFDNENRLKKKYKILETSGKYVKGQFVNEDCDVKNKELAFGTTIHGVQGKTFENKLFVDTYKMFEWGMIYTAISRLRTEKNLYIIV